MPSLLSIILIGSMVGTSAASVVAVRGTEASATADWLRDLLVPQHGAVIDDAIALALDESLDGRDELMLAFAEAILKLDSEIAESLAGTAGPSAAHIVMALAADTGRSLGDIPPISHRLGTWKQDATGSSARVWHSKDLGDGAPILLHAETIAIPTRHGVVRPALRLLSAAQPLGP